MRCVRTYVAIGLGALALVVLLCAASFRPFNAPHYETVQPNETAFLVPLDEATTDQKQLRSEDYWRKTQVSTKRIFVPRRWIQTGRFGWEGQYVDSYALLKVSLSPETREWTESQDTGTSTHNQGITAETSESTSFMARMNCSCQIDEANAAQFLHGYAGRQLETVMDADVRAIVESQFVEQAAHYRLEEILKQKDHIMDQVRKNVRDYCKQRGITLNYLGLKGDFTYPNPAIQEALDNRFRARQEKIAQDDINTKNLRKAEADARVAQTMATAHGQQALDYQYRLRRLENESKMIDILKEKWDGRAPTVVGTNSVFNSLFSSDRAKTE